MKPEIVFEDDTIIVCVKPSGTATQTASLISQDMVSLLKNHLTRQARKNGTPIKGEPYLAVIHRLDQPVEGLLVFAKTKQAASDLSGQLQKDHFGKYYMAVTEGIPSSSESTLTDYLIRDGKTNLSSVCSPETPGSKKAILTYQVVSTKNQDDVPLSVLRIHLLTGRHHQIRVQLSHAGFPLVGDRKYNPNGIPARRLSLCAYRLDIHHPVSGKAMHFEITPSFL